jgi:hypothetical protein
MAQIVRNCVVVNKAIHAVEKLGLFCLLFKQTCKNRWQNTEGHRQPR